MNNTNNMNNMDNLDNSDNMNNMDNLDNSDNMNNMDNLNNLNNLNDNEKLANIVNQMTGISLKIKGLIWCFAGIILAIWSIVDIFSLFIFKNLTMSDYFRCGYQISFFIAFFTEGKRKIKISKNANKFFNENQYIDFEQIKNLEKESNNIIFKIFIVIGSLFFLLFILY